MHYIVAAVVTNDHQEVLMMQEAKESCRGKWYLPAGRVEPNETLEVSVFYPISFCAVGFNKPMAL